MNYDIFMIRLMYNNPTLDNNDFFSIYCSDQENLKLECRKWLVERKDVGNLSNFDRLAMFNMLLGTAYNHLDELSAESVGIIWYDPKETSVGITELEDYMMNLKADLTELLILPA